jgi:hypothetical protein
MPKHSLGETELEAIEALVYVMGIYALTLGVTLLVCLVIVAIRWAIADRSQPATTGSKQGGKK